MSKNSASKRSARPTVSAAIEITGLTAPATRDELRRFLIEYLDVRFPDAPIVTGHSSPLDYLAHTFFEGMPPPATDAAPTRGDAVDHAADGPIVDCIVWANRGGGKTFLGAIATLLDLVFKDGIQVRILGGSMDQSQRMHEHLRTFFAREPLSPMLKGSITDRRITLANKSSVELLSQSQTSVRGTRVQKLRCDEVELFDPDVWEAAQLVTRSRRCAGILVRGAVECLSTMHLSHGIMHDLLLQAAGGTRKLFKWGVVDTLENCNPARPCAACSLEPECAGRAKRTTSNPAATGGHISIDDAVRMKSRVALATWESEMLCLRPARTLAVVPEFDPKVHIVDEIPDDGSLTWIGGMDFGMRAPTVVLWARLDFRSVVWVVHERWAAGEILDTHIAAILDPAMPRLQWLAADPAGGSTNLQSGVSDIDCMRRRGITMRTQRSDVVKGLALIRARLRPADNSGARLFIHRRCVKLIESLERFGYSVRDPDSETPDKGKGHDHAVDALRYMLLALHQPNTSHAGTYN